MVYFTGFVVSMLISAVNGWCAYPCDVQNKTFTRITAEGTDFPIPNSGAFNRTTLIFNVNGKELYQYCHLISGPFMAVRINNGTHDLYGCGMTVAPESVPDVQVTYIKPFVYFESPPTLCEVCDGNYPMLQIIKDVAVDCKVVQMPEEIKCNIPAVCPVVKEGQIKCPRCSATRDDGLCC